MFRLFNNNSVRSLLPLYTNKIMWSTSFCFSFCWRATCSEGKAEERWVLNGPFMNHCSPYWMGLLSRVWLTCVIQMKTDGGTVLQPLNVPAEVRHLNIAPDHEGTSQVKTLLWVSSDKLVVFTEGITEDLIQSVGYIKSRPQTYFNHLKRCNCVIVCSTHDVCIYRL